jgi:hypothetical protein
MQGTQKAWSEAKYHNIALGLLDLSVFPADGLMRVRMGFFLYLRFIIFMKEQRWICEVFMKVVEDADDDGKR